MGMTGTQTLPLHLAGVQIPDVNRRSSVLARCLSPHGRSGLEGQERKLREDGSSKLRDINQLPAEPQGSKAEHLRM